MQATERWVCAGRRIVKGGKLATAWWDGERELLFAKTPGTIGATYDVEVTREGDRVSMRGKPTYVATVEIPNDDQVSGWKVEDADAYHEIETKRAEKRAAEDDAVQDALDVLRRHFGACQTYSAKWGFAQWVAAEVARPPRITR